MKWRLLTWLLGLCGGWPSVSFAQNNSTPTPAATETIDPTKLPGSQLQPGTVIGRAVGLFLTIIALTAFISLLYSGIMYITAGADAAKAETARKNILWAIIGIILALIAYPAVTFVAGLLGK